MIVPSERPIAISQTAEQFAVNDAAAIPTCRCRDGGRACFDGDSAERQFLNVLLSAEVNPRRRFTSSIAA